MINHEYQCIFIHIQRTAGSSLEYLIDGRHWWGKELRHEKHLLASQARKLYAPYWDSYFKFSFVRNPWSRMVSMLRWGAFLGVTEENGHLNISKYKKTYGFPLTVEFDTRFHKKSAIPKGGEGCAYSNILDEELDFIGKYENLEEDSNVVFRTIGLNQQMAFNKPQKSYDSLSYHPYYTEKTRRDIEVMYKNDLVKYGYEF